jgi:autotransporter-associated beta strand protein
MKMVISGGGKSLMTRKSRPDRQRNIAATRVLLAASSAAAAMSFCSQSIGAATLTWDGGDATINGTYGGSGTWDLSTANWSSGSVDVAWSDTSSAGTDSGIFTGTAGTATLNTSLSSLGLQFLTSGYTISGSGTLTLGSGGLNASTLTGSTTSINSGLSLMGGQSWTSGSGATLAISGTVTRNVGATVDFSTNGTFNGAGLLAAVGTSVDGWATFGGADWAVNNGGSIAAVASYAPSLAATTAPGSTANVDFQASNTTSWSTQTINSLRFATAAATTLSLASSQILTDTTGGILETTAVGANLTTITGGTIKGSSGGDLVVIQNNTSGALAITSIIADDSTATALTKSGPGSLFLNSANTYHGGTIINAGLIGVGNSTKGAASENVASLGVGGITACTGGTLTLGYITSSSTVYDFANALTLAGGMVIAYDGVQHLQGGLNVTAAGGTIASTFNDAGKGFYFDGLTTGTGNLTVQFSSLDTGHAYDGSTVHFTSTGTASANSYNGIITVNPTSGSLGGSYLQLDATNALANATINLSGNNSGSSLAHGTPLLLFKAGLGATTIGGLSGSGSIPLADLSSTPVAVALTVGNNNANTTYSGTLSGTGSLTKTGSGMLTLSGNSTFAGGVTINGGTINIPTIGANDGSTSSLGLANTAKNITINAGATLSGTINNWFGNATNSDANLPSIIVNGGTLQTTRFTTIGNLTLDNGALVTNTTTDSGGYQAFSFRGTVTAGGTSPSTITSTASSSTQYGYHLGSNTVFSVPDVTGDANADLIVSAALRDQDGDHAGAGGLTITGAGTISLSGASTYTGGTVISSGTLEANSTDTTNGSTGSGSVAVTGTLAGTGIIKGSITVNSGGHLTAGAGVPASGTTATAPGLLTANTSGKTVTFASGANFDVKVNNVAGSAGSGWDEVLMNLLSVTGTSDVNINLYGLTAANVAGQTTGFSTASPFTLKIAVLSGVSQTTLNSDLSAFALNTSNFTNNNTATGGTFSLVAMPDSVAGSDLDIHYSGTPEPGNSMLLLAGTLPALMMRRRRAQGRPL